MGNDDVAFLRGRLAEATGALAQLRRALPLKIAAATQQLRDDRDVLHGRLRQQEEELKSLVTRGARKEERISQLSRSLAKSKQQDKAVAELALALARKDAAVKQLESRLGQLAPALTAAEQTIQKLQPGGGDALAHLPNGSAPQAGADRVWGKGRKNQPERLSQRTIRSDALPWSERRQLEIQHERAAERQKHEAETAKLRRALKRATDRVGYLEQRGAFQTPAVRAGGGRASPSALVPVAGASDAPVPLRASQDLPDRELKDYALSLAAGRENVQRMHARTVAAERAQHVLQTQLQKQAIKLKELQTNAAEAAAAAAAEIKKQEESREAAEEEMRLTLLRSATSARNRQSKQPLPRTNASSQTTVDVQVGIRQPTACAHTQTTLYAGPESDQVAQLSSDGGGEDASLPQKEDLVQFAIGFETAPDRGAGTSADICIRFIGHDGSASGTFKFVNTGQFRSGSVSWFSVSAPSNVWDERHALPLAQLVVGHDIAGDLASCSVLTPDGDGLWLLHAVYVQRHPAEMDAATIANAGEEDRAGLLPAISSSFPTKVAAFWCGNEWFDSSSNGGVMRRFSPVSISTVAKRRLAPAPDNPHRIRARMTTMNVKHELQLTHPMTVGSAPPRPGVVTFADDTKGGAVEATTAAGSEAPYFSVTVYCKALSSNTVPITAQLGVRLHGWHKAATSGQRRSGADRAAAARTLVSTNVVVSQLRCRAVMTTSTAGRSENRQLSGIDNISAFEAWVPRNVADDIVEHALAAEQPMGGHPEAAAVSREILDGILGAVIEIVTEPARVATWVLGMALEEAVEQASAPQSAAEEVMQDVLSKVAVEAAVGSVSPAATQHLPMPRMEWCEIKFDSTDGKPGAQTATGENCEVHSVEVMDVSNVCGGSGAWIYVQGVEVVEVPTGKCWYFEGDAWLQPSAKAGGAPLFLRAQLRDLGSLLALG